MYIAIAGNIGSGKTSLTEILAERLGASANYEDTDNPYIEDFYEDMNKWSFNLQVYFLAKRLREALEMQRRDENIVQDRTIYEDAYIFAANLHDSGLMSTRDHDTYMKIFELSHDLIRLPDVLIYLRASVPTLVSQIQRRGRIYEMSIQEEYLQRLNERYEDWINNIYKGRVLVVDVDERDFILNPGIVDEIVDEINAIISGNE